MFDDIHTSKYWTLTVLSIFLLGSVFGLCYHILGNDQFPRMLWSLPTLGLAVCAFVGLFVANYDVYKYVVSKVIATVAWVVAGIMIDVLFIGTVFTR